MKVFLKLKHWQLFVITVGILLVLFLYNGISRWIDEENRFVLDAVVRFVTIIPFLIYFLWIWSVGTLLNKGIQKKLAIRTVYFSISVAVSYFIFFFLLVFNLFDWDGVKEQVEDDIWAYILMGVPLLIAFFAWLFALNFLAKSLVRAERETHVTSSEYYGEYIMALFFPIGIWILQPRINKIYYRMEKTEHL